MFFQAILSGLAIAMISLIGALFFGDTNRLVSAGRWVSPVAVGVFLALVLCELIPETITESHEFGGVVVAVGFLLFYVLANYLHKKFHHQAEDECDRKSAGVILLVGDAVHNVADGVVLGGAFLVDPAVGVVTAIGLALHEIPQEIIEFGVLLRAGYSKTKALFYNFLSATSILFGVAFVFLLVDIAESMTWILTGLAAGSLLFLATSDLLPRIHSDYKSYGGFNRVLILMIVGFLAMLLVLFLIHRVLLDHHAH